MDVLPMFNHPIRVLLTRAGLKVSLPRLKVLHALQQLRVSAAGVSAQELHHFLRAEGEPLSLQTVRQTLRGMRCHGMLKQDLDGGWLVGAEDIELEPSELPQNS